MKRALAGLALVGFLSASFPAVAVADECTFCSEELPVGIEDSLNCPNCIELAEAITRGNESIWVLDFEPGELQQVQIKDDTGDVETYWFLPYTLTNNDESPHRFFVDITAYSDRTRHPHRRDDELEGYFTDRSSALGNPSKRRGTARYHDMWIPDVVAEVERVLGVEEGEELWTQKELCMPPPGERNRQPRLRDKETKETAYIALPEIRAGQTIDCVAIFESIDPETDALSIFVRGLTNSSLIPVEKVEGEPPELPLDYRRPIEDDHERVITEAVLVLTYQRPGDEFAHSLDPIELVGRRWTDQSRRIRSDLAAEDEDRRRWEQND